jgi:hypothetical protein
MMVVQIDRIKSLKPTPPSPHPEVLAKFWSRRHTTTINNGAMPK